MAFCRPLRSVEGCRVLKRAVGSMGLRKQVAGRRKYHRYSVAFSCKLGTAAGQHRALPRIPQTKESRCVLDSEQCRLASITL